MDSWRVEGDNADIQKEPTVPEGEQSTSHSSGQYLSYQKHSE